MAFEQIDQNDLYMYMDTLRDNPTPFDSFVSRKNLEDVVDVDGPRKLIDRVIFKTLKQTASDHSTRLIPILGSAGSGKTHAYWAYSDISKKLWKKKEMGQLDVDDIIWRIVYVPSPPAATRILLHIYTCLINDIGAEIIDIVSKKLVERWGGKKKQGLFGKVNIDEVISNGIKEYPGVFTDCVKAMVIYQLDNSNREIAERWLLGSTLEEEEMARLKIKQVIENDDICLAMLKLIMLNIDYPVLIYFDEIESPYRMHGPDAERKFLETIKRLYNEVPNIVIVITVLKEIWNRILEVADQALKSRMEQEMELNPFSINDLKLYFAKAMKYFWEKHNINPPVYPLFPLNEQVLQKIYERTDGNQRQIIKLIKMFLDKIVNEEMTLDALVGADISPMPVPTPEPAPESAPVAATTASAAANATAQPNAIDSAITNMMQNEDYTIEVNPASIVGAMLKSLEYFAKENNLKIEVQFDLKFLVAKRTYTLPGAIKYNDKLYGLEVPAIKTFERSGGVAAFYAAKRLTDAKEQNAIEKGALIVPRGTGGPKFNLVVEKAKNFTMLIPMTEKRAEFLIKQALVQPDETAYQVAKYFFGDNIKPYQPPPFEDEPEEEPTDAEASKESSEAKPEVKESDLIDSD
jgi:hypothetical protein